MKQEQRKAKFFCENCGAEVPEDARFCKHCGRFFSAVRCPQCGATGTVKMFENGCPNCGYAMHSGTETFMLPNKKPQKKSAGDSPLPVWIYVMTIAVLSALLVSAWIFLK